MTVKADFENQQKKVGSFLKINLDKCIAYIKFSYYLCNVISSKADN